MPEAREGYGVVVLGDEQVVVARVVDGRLVVQVRVGPQPLDRELVLHAALVDGDQLLVEVVERRARRLEPVLEDGHVRGVPVDLVQPP